MQDESLGIDWGTVSVSVITFGVFVAVLIPVIWYWLRERLRQSIKHEYDTQVERLRAELRIDAYREEVKFSKLHERRAEVIAEAYALLRGVRREIMELVNYPNTLHPDDPNTKAGLVKISDAFTAFNSYFFPNQIYIPLGTVDAIVKLRNDYSLTVTEAVTKQKHAHREGQSDSWLSSIRKVRSELVTDLILSRDSYGMR